MSVRLQLALCYSERDSFVLPFDLGMHAFFRYHLTWRRKTCFFSLSFDLAEDSMLFFVTIRLGVGKHAFFRYHLTWRRKACVFRYHLT